MQALVDYHGFLSSDQLYSVRLRQIFLLLLFSKVMFHWKVSSSRVTWYLSVSVSPLKFGLYVEFKTCCAVPS